ncbi:hypothetical protein QZH41_002325 [Actinostola sp. cb2023]|nr:hypothetical protein QZH41_002325 [Actinostola sp. cb2023]
MNNVGSTNHAVQDGEDDNSASRNRIEHIKKKKRSKLRRVLSRYKIKKPRLVSKHGGLKVVATDVHQKQSMYVSDMFTTMIDAKWHWILLIFVTAYMGSWLLFGGLWSILEYIYGANYCVDNVDSFTTAFLFSLETQTTIGYGGRQITPKCPEAIILLNLQSLFGCFLNAFILGLIFARLSRPRNRAGTIMFSNKAVIAVRDGKMCLMFRVGDVRKSQILDCHIRVQLFRTRTTKEGLILPFYQQDLKVGIDWNDEQSYGNSTIFLILPLTVIHVIDEESPFFTMSPSELSESDFELVAIMEGTIEATGLLTQAKTSYVGDEIMWGFELKGTMGSSSWKGGRYRVDFSQFHNFIPVDTPRVSALEFYEGKLYPPSHRSSAINGSQSSDEVFSDVLREEVAVQTDDNSGDEVVEKWEVRQRKSTSVKEDRNGPMQFATNPGYVEGDDSDVLFV